jgi:hypothetical protein
MFKSNAAFGTWNTRFANKIAGCADGFGYVKVGILGLKFQAHRLIWAIHHDEWPLEIDHINHNRSDNRIANLRSVTSQDNKKNQGLSKRNSSGHIGVHWDAPTQKWRARINHNGVAIHIGLYSKLECAIQAYTKTKSSLGFHDNHGTKKQSGLRNSPAEAGPSP